MKVLCIAKQPAQIKKREFLSELITQHCRQNGLELELVWSEYHNHALEIIRKLEPARYELIIACGGDGTNFQILNGLLRYHDWGSLPSVAILPTGRGNSFARDLNIFTLEDGLRALDSGQTKPVDVCSFTQGDETFYFVNLMGFGFISDVAATAARFNFLGDFSYVVGVLIEATRLHFHRMQLTLDGQTIETDNCFVEFCNSRYTGGTMLMAPEARLDDGYFDVIITGPLSRLSLLKTFPRIYRGTHVTHPAVRVLRAQHAVVSCSPQKLLLPDGELMGSTPVEIGIKPGLISYCL